MNFLVAAMVALAAADGGAKGDGGVVSSPVAPENFKNPIHISANDFKALGKNQVATWLGSVKVVRGSTTITCDRLMAWYTKNEEISRLECHGNVEAVDGDRWVKGDKAEFEQASGVLVLTGSPIARQGKNMMRGTKITFHVGGEVLEVEKAETVFETSPALPKKPAGAKKGSK